MVWYLRFEDWLLTACNAGHENPVVKSPKGDVEILKDKHCFVVGWDKDTEFNEYTIQLEKGSKLYLYTDGVPESSNGNERFGSARMLETLIKNENLSSENIVKGMTEEINNFVGKQDQFDDTTMLCLEFKEYYHE